MHTQRRLACRDGGLSLVSEKKITPDLHRYLKGYFEAIEDYGIWKNGTQIIGCLENPIKLVKERKLREHGLTLEEWFDHESR